MSFLDMDEKRAELNALIAFVDRPRRLGAIVAHSDRPLHAIRGQLISLVAAGRLTHPEHGFFAPAGFKEPIVRHPKEHRASSKGSSLATQVLSLVDSPKVISELAVMIGQPIQTLHRLASRLVEQGHLCRPVPGVVAPADFDLARYVSSDTTQDVPVIMQAIKACLAQPRQPAEICAELDLDSGKVRNCLKSMARAGQVKRLGYALCGLPDACALAPRARRRQARSQPIRDAILAYVAEPRRACEIAVHISRPTATATGHLAAMKRLGLIVQTERGVYLRANRKRADLKQRQIGIAA